MTYKISREAYKHAVMAGLQSIDDEALIDDIKADIDQTKVVATGEFVAIDDDGYPVHCPVARVRDENYWARSTEAILFADAYDAELDFQGFKDVAILEIED